MSKEEPKTTDVLDTAANQGDRKENETVNKDAVTNAESATNKDLVTEQSVTASYNDEAVIATSDKIQETKKDKQPTATTAKKSTESKLSKQETKEVVVSTKEEPAKGSSTKQESKKDQTTKGEKAADLKQVKEDKKAEDETTVYPFTIRPIIPVAIFRGPSLSFAGRTFGGFMEIIGPSKDGFFPVSYVRAGLGRTTGYIHMTNEEVRKCQSWR